MTPIELLKKAHSDIFALAINGEVRNLREIYNLMGEAIKQLERTACDEDLISRLESSLLNDETSSSVTLSRKTATQLFNFLNERSSRSREKVILSICDEDLEQFDIDPDTVRDEEFDAIAEEMAEYFDESFQQALHYAIKNVLGDVE
jgi:hypothetical protein